MTFNRNHPVQEQVLNHTMGHIRGKIVDINGKAIEGSKILIRETGQNICSDKQGTQPSKSTRLVFLVFYRHISSR
jgi:hypothetical protein